MDQTMTLTRGQLVNLLRTASFHAPPYWESELEEPYFEEVIDAVFDGSLDTDSADALDWKWEG